ncbi:MAG TPA: hypothetical protein VHX86_01185 [Tepidisphaeraceae bacterium]|jgi:hypothetical protein|nr:hypothetical protein [Tepidisphaeraceae bacterium]
MAQAPAVNTDELLSQLAASEIDRLLAEADGKPASAPAASAMPDPSANQSAAATTSEILADGPERAALLQAAGFDAAHGPAPESADAAAGQPTGDERSALLKAAGFESAEAPPAPDAEPALSLADALSDDSYQPTPIYLKPLVWMNAPLDACPSMVRRLLGGAGLVTLVNALAVLSYVFFFRKH